LPTHLGSVHLANEALRVRENNLERTEFESRVVNRLSNPKVGAVEYLVLHLLPSKIIHGGGGVVSILTSRWAMVGPVVVQDAAIIARFYLRDALFLFSILLPFDHLYLLTKDLSKPLEALFKVRHDDACTRRNVLQFESKREMDERREIMTMKKEKLLGLD
jgi:hypothetical protein